MPVDVKFFLAVLPQVISLIAEASRLIPTAGAVPKYLDLLAAIVGQGERAYSELSGLRELIAAMVAQQREPNEDEWTALQTRSDIASATIQSYDFDSEVLPGIPPATL